MKNKTDLLYTLGYILAACLLFSMGSCRSRKVDKDLTKASVSQVSSSKVDLKESSLSVSSLESLSKEKNWSVTVEESSTTSPDGTKITSKKTSYSNSEKTASINQENKTAQNKALQVIESKKQASSQIIKDKSTEVKGMSVGQSFAIGLGLVAVAMFIIFFKKIFSFFKCPLEGN